MPTNFRYTMTEASGVARTAAAAVEAYLRSLPETVLVKNVENDPRYQQEDVDLLWKYRSNESVTEARIEIKGDRWYKTGNYFFETVSNESKNTPGCFLYTKADFVYYCFVEEKELHILPMPETRDWFMANLDRFRERKTSTPVGEEASYVTVGRLVPRNMAISSIGAIKVVNL
jgi:hypothetical protein